jgi:hypothetical protein
MRWGNKSLDHFLGWFVPISCNIGHSGDREAIELAQRIDGVFPEASSAQCTEEEIREELRRPFVAPSFAENVVGDPSSFPITIFGQAGR